VAEEVGVVSAELLRKAAGRLRLRADRLPGAMADRPWRIVQTDSDSMDGVAACSDHDPEVDLAQACVGCWVMETGHEAAAAYVVLMHPPVALALADWLDQTAAEYDDFDLMAENLRHMPDSAESRRAPTMLARAILREDSP
jgi:hypothetical protein